jgi:hypothetical protein
MRENQRLNFQTFELLKVQKSNTFFFNTNLPNSKSITFGASEVI